MIRFYRPPPPPDIEEGMPNEANPPRRRIATTNQCIFGLAFLVLFIRYPLFSLLVLFCLLLCASGCLRFIVQYSRHILGDDSVNGFWTQLNLLRLPSDVNITNLRLTLLDRDFNENDYDMLLALDDQPVTNARTRELTHDEMESLPLVVYETSGGKEEMCSVCLEVFRNGDRLRGLPCQHKFHEACIGAWLRQKGAMTACPICKKRILSTRT